METETDYYELLRLTPSCTTIDIRKAYKKLALRHHPDKGGDANLFSMFLRAKETLEDPQERRKYDFKRQQKTSIRMPFTQSSASTYSYQQPRRRTERQPKKTYQSGSTYYHEDQFNTSNERDPPKPSPKKPSNRTYDWTYSANPYASKTSANGFGNKKNNFDRMYSHMSGRRTAYQHPRASQKSSKSTWGVFTDGEGEDSDVEEPEPSHASSSTKNNPETHEPETHDSHQQPDEGIDINFKKEKEPRKPQYSNPLNGQNSNHSNKTGGPNHDETERTTNNGNPTPRRRWYYHSKYEYREQRSDSDDDNDPAYKHPHPPEFVDLTNEEEPINMEEDEAEEKDDLKDDHDDGDDDDDDSDGDGDGIDPPTYSGDEPEVDETRQSSTSVTPEPPDLSTAWASMPATGKRQPELESESDDDIPKSPKKRARTTYSMEDDFLNEAPFTQTNGNFNLDGISEMINGKSGRGSSRKRVRQEFEYVGSARRRTANYNTTSTPVNAHRPRTFNPAAQQTATAEQLKLAQFEREYPSCAELSSFSNILSMKAPSPPQTPDLSGVVSFDQEVQYAKDVNEYLKNWYIYNDKMLIYFNERQKADSSLGDKLYKTMMAQYMTALQLDVRAKKDWDYAQEMHMSVMRQVGIVQDHIQRQSRPRY